MSGPGKTCALLLPLTYTAGANGGGEGGAGGEGGLMVMRSHSSPGDVPLWVSPVETRLQKFQLELGHS